MNVMLFNNTHRDWWLHGGSLRGMNGEHHIPAQQMVVFQLPDGSDVFVKVWDTGTVLVLPFRDDPSPQRELPFGD